MCVRCSAEVKAIEIIHQMQIDNVDDLTTAPLTPNSPIIDNNQSPDGFASSFSSGSSDTISGEYSIELFIWRILFGFLIVF